jgi:hypothetical protein
MFRHIVFVAAGLGFLILAYWVAYWIAVPRYNEDTLHWATPTVPHDFQGKLTIYRDKAGEDAVTVDGNDLYITHHRHGWEDCRFWFCFCSEEDNWRYEEDSQIWMIAASGCVNRARQDGWKTCSNQIETLLQDQSDDALRDHVLVWRRVEAAVVGCLVLVVGLIVSSAAAKAFTPCRLRRTPST